MKTPFTVEQFFGVFESYNSGVFPVQILISVLGLLGVILLHSGSKLKNQLTGGFLGILWIWTGLVYHIGFFSSINQAAYVFGGVFIVQGLLLLFEALVSKRLEFEFKGKLIDYLGYFFILFGLIIYPIISYILEQSMVKTIAPGLPCPSTILTFGFLMLTGRKFPKYLLIIPSLWAIIGLGAAINFGVYQDFVMILAAIVADIFLIVRKKNI